MKRGKLPRNIEIVKDEKSETKNTSEITQMHRK